MAHENSCAYSIYRIWELSLSSLYAHYKIKEIYIISKILIILSESDI